MVTLIKGFIFYVCAFVIAIFFCGGCETFTWYLPTILSGFVLYAMFKQYGETGFMQYSGMGYFQKIVQEKTGVNIFDEEE